MAETWNPLFVAYARVHGHEPQQQLDHDQKAWPGGCMCGFMLWMSALKERFRKLHPEAFFEPETSIGRISDYKVWYTFVTSQT